MFDKAATDVVTDYTVNGKRSKAELERRIKLHVTPAFGGRRLSAITTADLRAFTATRLAAKASAGEISRELAIVRRAFEAGFKAPVSIVQWASRRGRSGYRPTRSATSVESRSATKPGIATISHRGGSSRRRFATSSPPNCGFVPRTSRATPQQRRTKRILLFLLPVMLTLQRPSGNE